MKMIMWYISKWRLQNSFTIYRLPLLKTQQITHSHSPHSHHLFFSTVLCLSPVGLLTARLHASRCRSVYCIVTTYRMMRWLAVGIMSTFHKMLRITLKCRSWTRRVLSWSSLQRVSREKLHFQTSVSQSSISVNTRFGFHLFDCVYWLSFSLSYVIVFASIGCLVGWLVNWIIGLLIQWLFG